MKHILILGALVLAVAQTANAQKPDLYNPYERLKNGPPLTSVFHKARTSWLLTKLLRPKHHPAARMPNFSLGEADALDIMAYLKSIAGPPPHAPEWPAWASKSLEEMDDDEFSEMIDVVDRGKAVWGNARCTICHTVYGPGGELIGGFVDLRTGGIDLQIAGAKLKRDWLYSWIKEPKSYFPDTLMPHYRFSEEDLRALVEFILRDDAFRPPTDQLEARPEHWTELDEPSRVARGKRLIGLLRCVICHDIKGVPEILPMEEHWEPPTQGGFEFLVYDLRCLSCHSVGGRGGTYAPDLSAEGSRLREAWIERFVRSPDMIRPLSQQMPEFNLSAEEAQTIASSVSTILRDSRIPDEIPGGPVTATEIQLGREAFQTRGCFSCHTVTREAAGGVGPDLRNVGDRMTAGSIWFHLMNPHAVNAYSAEPDDHLPEEEARVLAAYLATRRR